MKNIKLDELLKRAKMADISDKPVWGREELVFLAFVRCAEEMIKATKIKPCLTNNDAYELGYDKAISEIEEKQKKFLEEFNK